MKMFNIGRNTLRLYEEMGLLTGMGRTEAGYREYNKTHAEDLQFIMKAKEAGFTLNEIKTILSTIKANQTLTCGTVSKEISGKINEIDSEIKILLAKKDFLNQFLETCSSKNDENKCDVVGAGFNKKACCN
ncbi:MAG: MerR family transcriptional regulator [Bdellovibrionaceae bacterium]|nr:MerR family transcriptional regulator [Pseudobdellovibrionaceae bacterium]